MTIRLLQSSMLGLLVCVFMLVSLKAFAQEPRETKFEVTPKRCVTLRQGQPCFVRVKFKWQTTKELRACLFTMEGKQIKCWQTAKEGSIVLPQNLPNTTEYILVDSEGVEIERTSVVVSWVYRKKRSKRRWRLF